MLTWVSHLSLSWARWIQTTPSHSTGLFEMIVGVLTTCHTQYTWVFFKFYLREQHSKFLLHTLQALCMCTICDSTNINMIIEFVSNWQVVKTPTIILNNPVFKIHFSIIPHLHPCISNDPFLQVSPPEFCVPLSMHPTCPAHLIILFGKLQNVILFNLCIVEFLGANAGKGRVPNQTMIEILSWDECCSIFSVDVAIFSSFLSIPASGIIQC